MSQTRARSDGHEKHEDRPLGVRIPSERPIRRREINEITLGILVFFVAIL